MLIADRREFGQEFQTKLKRTEECYLDNWGDAHGAPLNWFALPLSWIVFALAGCGGTYDATVSGVVLLDGTKLTVGTVTYHPVAGGAACYAQVHEDGTYEIRTGRDAGLQSGEYDVTVLALEPPADLHPKGGGPPTPGKPITPSRYGAKQTSGLRVTVESGDNTINLELTSQPPTK
jgi:hypothetical protein